MLTLLGMNHRSAPLDLREQACFAEDDVPAALARIEERFSDGEQGHLDGISVDYDDWHFNVRASNTEPLLRLNLGADSQALMEEKRDLVLSVILEG